VRLRLLQAERVELRFQMAADAVAADQHQHADAVELGGADGGRVEARCRGGCALAALRRRRRLGLRREAAARAGRPGGAGGVGQHGAGIIAQRVEQIGEGRIDAAGLLDPAGVEVGEIGGIGARHRTGEDVDSGHGLLRAGPLRAGVLAACLCVVERVAPGLGPRCLT
jgi:hypothetical protein